ncbi:MAG: ferredoxin [Acidimicrobiales bacterium]
MTSMYVTVDPTRCDGHGICSLLFAERIDLDDWGFATVDETVFDDPRLAKKARRAVAACPEGALAIELALGAGSDAAARPRS